MKSIVCFSVTLLSVCFGFSQEKEVSAKLNLDKEKFLNEVSDNACKCIDSINTYNKSKKEISADISSCIDKQTTVYQLGLKLASLNLDAIEKSNTSESQNITINTNTDSKDYKKYYYEIERHLTSTCKAVKDKISVMDKENSNSVSDNPLALKYYSEGLKEYDKGNFEKAIEIYKKAIAVDKNFAFAYDNIGVCYRKLNNFDKAIEYYEKSLKIDPNGMMPLQNIAIAYNYKKEYKKAIKAYEKIAQIDPNNPEVFYGIGQIYFQYLNDYEKSLDNMCQAYNIYVAQNSPYRADAEKIIQMIYNQMKSSGKESVFDTILKKHGIAPE